MTYSIGDIAKMIGVATSTLRYYDREGFFPNMTRSNGGIRVFTDLDVEWLKMIDCLKSTGMPIKDIKQFLDWCNEGDSSLHQRRDMFYERKQIVAKQMQELQKTLDMIQYKCWYYDTAVEAGSETAPKNIPTNELSEQIRKLKEAFL